MEAKKWIKSKTVGFSAGIALLGLAILALPEFQAIIDGLPVEYLGYAGLVVAVINTVLRFVTDQPIK